MSNIEEVKDLQSLFQRIKIDLTSYVNNRFAHYRLDLVERTSQYSSLLALILIITFLSFSVFAFALVGVALYIGHILGSTAAGFGVVALFWLVALIIVLFFRNKIQNFFLNKAAELLYKIEKEEDDDVKNE